MKKNMKVMGSVDNEEKMGFFLFPHKYRKGLFALRLMETGVAPFSEWDRIKSMSTPWTDALAPYADRVIEVTAEDMPLADAEFATMFPNCEEISLQGTRVSDITPLSVMRRLRSVDIAKTCVTDISPLRCMKRLKRLDVSRTRVSDISVLTTTRRMEYLNVSYTDIRDISAVGSLKRLRTLNASGNEYLKNIDPLCGCTAMRYLELSNTGVDRVDAVGSMPWLHDLFLGGTPIGKNKGVVMQTKTIYVNAEEAAKIDRLLNTQPSDEEHCMGGDELYSETAVFDDGYEVDVKLCGVRYEEGGNNTPWTEAVLFKDGCEVTCTDVFDEFFGEWRLETDGETYVVFVERCEPDNPENPKTA